MPTACKCADSSGDSNRHGIAGDDINKKNSLGLTWAEIGRWFRCRLASAQQSWRPGWPPAVRVVVGEKTSVGPESNSSRRGAAFVAERIARLRVFADPREQQAVWNFSPRWRPMAIYIARIPCLGCSFSRRFLSSDEYLHTIGLEQE